MARPSARCSSLLDLGVAVSLDDFGTGYSSLGQLWSLPMDRLKVDRSFVADLNANLGAGSGGDAGVRAIVRTIITLARSLGLQITAEGVETAEQRSTLLELGVSEAQGWLFHRARPAAQLSAMLAAA